MIFKSTHSNTNPLHSENSLADVNTQRRTMIRNLSFAFTGLSVVNFKSPIQNDHRLPTGEKDENYWKAVKKQFTLEKGLIFLNAVNLAPSPASVSSTLASFTQDIDANPSTQNREKYTQLHKEVFTKLGTFFNVDPPDLIVTRNTSESNNMVINDLKFNPGDEVVIWDQNHQSNKDAWEMRAARYGIVVKKIAVPSDPKEVSDLLKPFQDAVTSKTKMVAFSHISNVSGIKIPAEELCQWCREKNILTLLDGAQSFGALDLDLKKIGCDFYSGSAHKWFLGPREAGILYIRNGLAEQMWPSIITAGWDNAKKSPGAGIMSNFGQRDYATMQAMGAAADFHLGIGKNNIEMRLRSLLSGLRKKLQSSIPGVKFATPENEQLSGGLLVVQLPGADHGSLAKSLYEKHKIACSGAPGNSGLRIAPHVYVQPEELDKLAEALSTTKG